MQNRNETRGNLCTEFEAPMFQAISNLINGKKSVAERPKKGWTEFAGQSLQEST